MQLLLAGVTLPEIFKEIGRVSTLVIYIYIYYFFYNKQSQIKEKSRWISRAFLLEQLHTVRTHQCT